MIEPELFKKNTRFYQKNQNFINIYTFSNLFYLFCSRLQGKAHGRDPPRPIYHRLQTRGNLK